MFNMNIDNDITYLLEQIGYNVKINNLPCKAIVNNSSMERTNDDKRIIVKSELSRGDYVEYSDLYFLVLNEINDKRYNTYKKGLIRNCNYNIKFMINDKLYLFYSIMESDKFNIDDGKLFSTLADTMTVTLPKTAITESIKIQDKFIKFNKSWTVEGVDYTRKGLIILNCKAGMLGANDDLENEIANRFDSGDNDILNGNITPIIPFDEIVEPEEPTEPEIPVDPEEPIEPLEDDFTIEIVGADRFGLMTETTFTAKVLNNGVEVADKEVVFSVNNTLAIIKSQGDNVCRLETNKQFKTGTFVLTATLVDDKTVFAEKEIIITGL